MKNPIMYSLYDCDEWRSTDSMRLEYETLDRDRMNDKIREVIQENFDDYEEKLTNEGISIDKDDLVKQVVNQTIDFLYLVIREIDIQNKVVEIVG